jgi:hypothetical protein
MTRWLRVVWPPWGACLAGVVLYLAAEGQVWLLERQAGMPLPVNPRPSLVVLLIAAGSYGLYRVSTFHPALRPGYRAWLETTPWTSRRPLPLGPVRLAPQDVLLGILVLAFAWPTHGLRTVWVLQCFAVAYLGMLAVTLATTQEGLAYAVAFGLGLVVRLWPQPLPCLLAAAGTYTVGYVALRRALARFPWPPEQGLRLEMRDGNFVLAGSPTVLVGWPFGCLGPKFPDDPRIPLPYALLTSALVGWWVHVIGCLPSERPERMALLSMAVLLLAPAASFIRWAVYCSGYAPPISLWGRLLTGRWIIKGYDQVFVGPLLSFWAGTTIAATSLLLGVPPEVGVPVAVAVNLAICLGLGPELKTWRLTGNHRLVAPLSQKGTSIQVG